MENCSDKYLHKKFKKQTNCEAACKAAYDGKEGTTDNHEDDRYRDKVLPHESSINTKSEETDDIAPNLIGKSSISSLVSVKVDSSDSDKEAIVGKVFVRNLSPLLKYENDCISSSIDLKPDELPTNVNFSSTLDVDNKSSVNFFDQNIKSESYISSFHEEQPQNSESREIVINEKSSGGKYVCSYCNLACSKPSVLQKHIRAHTNERPYPCLSCGFSFKTRSNLYKHCRSRTHANRMRVIKTQEANFENNEESQIEQNHFDNNEAVEVGKENTEIKESENRMLPDSKSKPYKPRFHTKVFYENSNEDSYHSNMQNEHSDYLCVHINEVINKNNAIVNSNDQLYPRKRSFENNSVNDSNSFQTNSKSASSYFPHNMNLTSEERHVDEPLNLSNKNRKRCVSEVTEPSVQKSLIKELLLKNLYADTNMQCPYCKMIFQTVTELELHKLRSCKGFTKSGVEYNRSNSVNVASILTHNKNAFDSLSQYSSPFALKSPGPFLGKTRLVESDKGKSFSFDDNLPSKLNFSSFISPNDILKTSQRYSLSPLTIQLDKERKPSIKMFGGEVKITQKSGESKSYIIDHQDSEDYEVNSNFIDYGGKVRENRVVKSSLQSGGTVLQGKPSNYNKNDSKRSPEVIRVYEPTALSPSIDVHSLEKQFSFPQHHEQTSNRPQSNDGSTTGSTNFNISTTNVASNSYKYTNIMDFSQKAAKMIAPNLKQPNLAVPGIPIPNRLALVTSVSSSTPETKYLFQQSKLVPSKTDYFFHSAPKQNNSSIPSKHHESPISSEVIPPQITAQNIYNPVNLLVNGKVVRYVPGIPGPVVAESPVINRNIPSNPSRVSSKNCLKSPKSKLDWSNSRPSLPERSPMTSSPVKNQNIINLDRISVENNERLSKMDKLEIKITEPKSIDEQKSPSKSLEARSPVPFCKPTDSTRTIVSSSENQRKFSRPNTLALKPSISTLKQHHGLTPTMFNQILISPDTPRVAKKYNQHFLNGNYFSYLGLKSSTRPTYCTLNKTQPFYVPHFKKLSMYSEWRQQESKADELYLSAYDSSQKQRKYTTAGKNTVNLVVHSSYESEAILKESRELHKYKSSLFGGYESNENYTYVRGRGRGRYVCDECGIRCKKPSMLKKHIRTHTNERPYTCSLCNFSFKTKGNLTKHMKSKAHTMNSAPSRCSSSSAQLSGTQSSETDTDDSGMDSSDESTRQQEHEAAYGLLSLSQNPRSLHSDIKIEETKIHMNSSFMNTERVTHVNNTNYAKNKILDYQSIPNIDSLKIEMEQFQDEEEEEDSKEHLSLFLGKTTIQRPLTYPYLSVTPGVPPTKQTKADDRHTSENLLKICDTREKVSSPQPVEVRKIVTTVNHDPKHLEGRKTSTEKLQAPKPVLPTVREDENSPSDLRKRKISVFEPDCNPKQQKQDSDVIDLSCTSDKKHCENGNVVNRPEQSYSPQVINLSKNHVVPFKMSPIEAPEAPIESETSPPVPKASDSYSTTIVQYSTESSESFNSVDYDNSAMQTLADVATKQVKLEKNSIAKNVASAYLKLATKNEFNEINNYSSNNKDVNELMVKSEENKSCSICFKNFNKPSQLRLHMNIHYLERPFRCDSCSVSFRTKGHLQKHERSASHHNKLSSSPTMSSSEPRPFKCSDCSIAFRIHGHLAKHLRSKMHIMKLECLAKIPFGLYAELERANSLLTEINTTDGDQCLESLRALAKKVFINDPKKLNHFNVSNSNTDS